MPARSFICSHYWNKLQLVFQVDGPTRHPRLSAREGSQTAGRAEPEMKGFSSAYEASRLQSPDILERNIPSD